MTFEAEKPEVKAAPTPSEHAALKAQLDVASAGTSTWILRYIEP